MPKHLSHKQLMIIGAVAVLALAFLWWRSRQASATAQASSGDAGSGVGTSDYGGTDDSSGYADLAGGLQGAEAQESGDVSTLQSGLSSLGTAEATDASNITGLQTAEGTDASNISTLQAALTGALASNATLGQRLNKVVATVNKDKTTIAKQGKLLDTLRGKEKDTHTRKVTHTKTGSTKSAKTAGHTNANHPAGTAGSAVAARSHAPKRPPRR